MLYLILLSLGAINFTLTIEQMAILGVDSLVIILLTTSFAGMVMAYQLSQQARMVRSEFYVGAGVVLTMARELAPLLTAVVMAGRVGSAITAQIASMKVTEQIDALRSLATNPIKYLVTPRFFGMSSYDTAPYYVFYSRRNCRRLFVATVRE